MDSFRSLCRSWFCGRNSDRLGPTLIRQAILTRENGDDSQGTFGDLVTDSGFTCKTLELPWRQNAPHISCIPTGEYLFKWMDSPKRGKCFHLVGASLETMDGDLIQIESKARTYIEIHSANLAGDTSLGYVSQLEGCIAPGIAKCIFRGGEHPAGQKNQLGISSSREALLALHKDLGIDDFKLIIRGGK